MGIKQLSSLISSLSAGGVSIRNALVSQGILPENKARGSNKVSFVNLGSAIISENVCPTLRSTINTLNSTYKAALKSLISKRDDSSTDFLNNIISLSTSTTVADYAFYGYSNLTSITIPGTVTAIGNWAFANCSKLSQVVLQSGVKTIGANAFNGCSLISNIVIPDSVTSIGANAFYGISESGIVKINRSAYDIKRDVNFPFGIINDRYIKCTEGRLYGNGTVVIEVNPSSNNYLAGTTYNVTRQFVGEGEKKSSDSVFTINISNEEFNEFKKDCFRDCRYLVYVNENPNIDSYEIGDYAFSNDIVLNSVPSKAIRIYNHSFDGCVQLRGINLPNCYSIGDGVFLNTSITSFNAAKCESIGAESFKNLATLSSLSIPLCKTIGKSAFEGCTAIKNIALNEINNIGNSAFSGCKNLSISTTNNNINSFGEGAFSGIKSLTLSNDNVTIKKIGSDCFRNVAFSCKNIVVTDDFPAFAFSQKFTQLRGDTKWEPNSYGVTQSFSYDDLIYPDDENYKIDSLSIGNTYLVSSDGTETFYGSDAIPNIDTNAHYFLQKSNYGLSSSTYYGDTCSGSNLTNGLTIKYRKSFFGGGVYHFYRKFTYHAVLAEIFYNLGEHIPRTRYYDDLKYVTFFYNCGTYVPRIGTLNLRNCKTIGSYSLQYLRSNTVKATKSYTIDDYAFHNANIGTLDCEDLLPNNWSTNAFTNANINNVILTSYMTQNVSSIPRYPWGLKAGTRITCCNGQRTV